MKCHEKKSANAHVISTSSDRLLLVLGHNVGYINSAQNFVLCSSSGKLLASISLCFMRLASYTAFLCTAGDVFHANWDEILVGATAVVSTVGGYGSEEEMQRINGEANIAAVNAAKNFSEHHV